MFCVILLLASMGAVAALYTTLINEVAAATRKRETLLRCQQLQAATLASNSSLKAYIDTADLFFLRSHNAAFDSAKMLVDELKPAPNLDLATLDFVRLQEQKLQLDADLLRQARQCKTVEPSARDWQIFQHNLNVQAATDFGTISKLPSGQLLADGCWPGLLAVEALFICAMQLAFVLGRRLDNPAAHVANKSLLAHCRSKLVQLSGSDGDGDGGGGLGVAGDGGALSVAGDDSMQSLRKAIDEVAEIAHSLKQNEKSMIDNAVDLICLLDAFGTFKKVSPSCLRITGYSPSELLGTRILDHGLEAENDRTTAFLHTASLSADLSTREGWFRTKSGGSICLRWSARWSASENALFAIGHDITARKIAEDLLASKEAELRTLFEALPAGVVVVDHEQKVVFWNTSLLVMLGSENDALVKGRALTEFLPDFTLVSSAPSSELLMHEDSACKVNGERFPVQISVAPLSSNQQTLIVIYDISSKVAVEVMKREFIAMISHDLKTPLSSIRAFMELLLYAKEPLPRRRVESMTAEVDRLMRLINDLLDMEKMRAGKFDVFPAEVEVQGLIDSAIGAVENLARMRKIDIERHETSARCYADGARTIQVLVNLLSNALKFSPKRSKIEVGVITENPGKIVLYVKDEGRGIPAEMHEMIFEKYAQANPSDATERSGTGLGLHICKLIIEEQGGEIRVESALSQGSTFYFSLPVESASHEQEGSSEKGSICPDMEV